MTQLSKDVGLATAVFLKIRKAREHEWDLPDEYSAMVEGKYWKKLIEMERKAYRLVEQLVLLVDKASPILKASNTK